MRDADRPSPEDEEGVAVEGVPSAKLSFLPLALGVDLGVAALVLAGVDLSGVLLSRADLRGVDIKPITSKKQMSTKLGQVFG